MGNTTTASGVAPWVRKAHQNVVSNAENWAYTRPFPAYDQANRIAGFTTAEQAGQQARGDMFNAGDPYAGMAVQGLGQAANSLENLSNVNPAYAAQQFDFGQFGQQEMNQYMNPYQQAVTDMELRAAEEDYQLRQNRTDAERVAAGSRGGHRAMLNQMMGEQLQAQTAADIQGRGSLAGVQFAAEQHERQRRADIRAAEMRDASAVEAARMGLEAGGMNQQLGLDRAKAYRNIGMSTSDLANQQQAREMKRIGALEQAGEQQRRMEQARMDLAYEEFMRDYNEPMTRMNFVASMLNAAPTQESYTKDPGKSTFSNIVGAGLGAAGIAKLLKGS
mgnify:CR=1 FL=1